jgi:hypothetical protein
MTVPLEKYIYEILGTPLEMVRVPDEHIERLPFYIKEMYRLFYARIFERPVVLAIVNEGNDFSSLQFENSLRFINSAMNKSVVLVLNNISVVLRSRLIGKKISFVVPGKQLYMPELMVDLREHFSNSTPRKVKDKLLPSAQFILLYHLLHDKDPITHLSFKELAHKFDYTQTAISLAVENLKDNYLCEVTGTKEKYIQFEEQRASLWRLSTPHLVSPVIKQVYVDKKPDVFLLHSNVSALSEYSNISQERQEYYAIEKGLYYNLIKKGALINENKEEGAVCLEVWKYDPERLVGNKTYESNVDPLSLYLSLKYNEDARIEMALEQIIDKFIW